jgi:hypothetical protein
MTTIRVVDAERVPVKRSRGRPRKEDVLDMTPTYIVSNNGRTKEGPMPYYKAVQKAMDYAYEGKPGVTYNLVRA